MTRAAVHRRRSRAVGAFVLLTLAGYAEFAQGSAQAPTQAKALAQAQAPAVAPAAEDIRDIRGPKPQGLGWPAPLAVIAGLLAAAGAHAAWRRHRRQRARAKTPFEIARDRLEGVRELMHQARSQEFSIEVSSTIRDYIESRFRVMAAHRTTDEFLHDLVESADSVLAANRVALAEFLQACDLAKFGGWNLSMASMETLLQSARRFVVESAPPQAARTGAAVIPSAVPKGNYDSIPST
jgi:hypothetical protein